MDLLDEYEDEGNESGDDAPSSGKEGSNGVQDSRAKGLGGQSPGGEYDSAKQGESGNAASRSGASPDQLDLLLPKGNSSRELLLQASGVDGPFSGTSSPASQSGDTSIDWAQVPQSESGVNRTLPEGGLDLPPAPSGPVDEAVKAEVARLLEQRKKGSNINSDLQDKKEFHNPGILERLVSEFKIQESGTNYSHDIFSPIYPKELHYETLNRQAAERDRLNRATRTSIGFESGGIQKPDLPKQPDCPPRTITNQQSALTAAAAASALAAAHFSASGMAAAPAHPPPTTAADGPVKKKSKWDSASKAVPGPAHLPAGVPVVHPQLSAAVGPIPGVLRPGQVGQVGQQLAAQQAVLMQQQLGRGPGSGNTQQLQQPAALQLLLQQQQLASKRP
jgi:hypothetical protein